MRKILTLLTLTALFLSNITIANTFFNSDSLSVTNNNKDKNIKIVTQFLDLAFNKKNVIAAAELVTDRYIQHNPYVADGKKGFIDGISAFHKAFPNLRWTLKHVYIDGDFVITHSMYEKESPYAIVDIFKIHNGKIDEHWDVSQKIPPVEESANSNTMF